MLPNDGTRDNEHKLKYRKPLLNFRKNWLKWGRSNTGPGCPQRWWSLHPWRYTNPSWTQSYATCSSWFCLSWGLYYTISRGAFQSQQLHYHEFDTIQQLVPPGQHDSSFNIHLFAGCWYMLFGRQGREKKTTVEEVVFSGLIKITDSEWEKASLIMTVSLC